MLGTWLGNSLSPPKQLESAINMRMSCRRYSTVLRQEQKRKRLHKNPSH